jgi:hypothetical protein
MSRLSATGGGVLLFSSTFGVFSGVVVEQAASRAAVLTMKATLLMLRMFFSPGL